ISYSKLFLPLRLRRGIEGDGFFAIRNTSPRYFASCAPRAFTSLRPSYRRGYFSPSHAPRRHHRRHVRCPQRRHQHRELPEQPQRHHAYRQIPKRQARHFEELHQHEVDADRQHHAHHDPERDDQEILGLEVTQDVRARRAERAADADLLAPLRDPETRQSHDSESGDAEQRDDHADQQAGHGAVALEEAFAQVANGAAVGVIEHHVRRDLCHRRAGLGHHAFQILWFGADQISARKLTARLYRHEYAPLRAVLAVFGVLRHRQVRDHADHAELPFGSP